MVNCRKAMKDYSGGVLLLLPTPDMLEKGF